MAEDTQALGSMYIAGLFPGRGLLLLRLGILRSASLGLALNPLSRPDSLGNRSPDGVSVLCSDPQSPAHTQLGAARAGCNPAAGVCLHAPDV